MSNKLIDIIDITKSYDENVILDKLNLYIRENEFLTLLGLVDVEKQHCYVFSVALRHRTPAILFLMEKYQQSSAKPSSAEYRIPEICPFLSYVHCRKYCFRIEDQR